MNTIEKPKHSLVGGSTCNRVLHCPGSVALVAKMPPKPSSSYADEGSLIHNVIAEHLDKGTPLSDFLGTKFGVATLTQDLIDNKILPAFELLNEIDSDKELEFVVEAEVSFGDAIPDAYGSADLIGRIGKKAIMLDWKMGSGVIVTAEESPQLMFYTAAAMRTPGLEWVFDGVDEIECVIIQPPEIRRWVTTTKRIKAFEQELAMAVKISQSPDAPLNTGEHCRWCSAKPVCPKMTGAVDRALHTQLDNIDAAKIGAYLANCDLLEQWITDLRALAHQMLEADKPVPGWKLVNKRATRQWANEDVADDVLSKVIPQDELYVSKIISPAQAEKVLKKLGSKLPDDLVVAISSGSTLAREDDSRPAVVNIGKQLTAALTKL